jgi:hypothetical protein
MHDSSTLQLHDHKDVERPEEDIVSDGEVAGPDVIGMVLQESGLGLAGGSTHFGHILLNRPVADPNT